MTQTAIETMRGVRITINPASKTNKLELEVLIKLTDSMIADRVRFENEDISDLTANLYSSRSHLVRALKEIA